MGFLRVGLRDINATALSEISWIQKYKHCYVFFFPYAEPRFKIIYEGRGTKVKPEGDHGRKGHLKVGGETVMEYVRHVLKRKKEGAAWRREGVVQMRPNHKDT